MAQRNQLTRPMVRRRAGFEANQAWRNPGKKRKDLAASQPLAQHHVACLVDRMDLEDTLCQIKSNCCNIAHGWLPLLVIFDDHHLGTSMPSGGHPPHQLAILPFKTFLAARGIDFNAGTRRLAYRRETGPLASGGFMRCRFQNWSFHLSDTASVGGFFLTRSRQRRLGSTIVQRTDFRPSLVIDPLGLVHLADGLTLSSY